MKAISFLLFSQVLFRFCSYTSDEPPFIADTPIVSVVDEVNLRHLGQPAILMTLLIRESDISDRQVQVRVTFPANRPTGALILTTGGFGSSFYGTSREKNKTLTEALALGLETYEVRWMGALGWGTGTEGLGYPGATKAFTDVVRFLTNQKMANDDILIAHGGSGGAFQIAYGLSRYGLDEVLTHGILVAGPPTTDLARAIFGGMDDPLLWDPQVAGFAVTDYIHGWRGNGDYCVNHGQRPPSRVIQTLEESSILPRREQVKLDYGAILHFVNTDDETNADSQGRRYYNAIMSSKTWHYLANEVSHDVAGIPEGAAKIREILEDIVRGSSYRRLN
ncbi:MAG: hypothetical protein AAGA85_06650 [Bacteroidota bacterium]